MRRPAPGPLRRAAWVRPKSRRHERRVERTVPAGPPESGSRSPGLRRRQLLMTRPAPPPIRRRWATGPGHHMGRLECPRRRAKFIVGKWQALRIEPGNDLRRIGQSRQDRCLYLGRRCGEFADRSSQGGHEEGAPGPVAAAPAAARPATPAQQSRRSSQSGRAKGRTGRGFRHRDQIRQRRQLGCRDFGSGSADQGCGLRVVLRTGHDRLREFAAGSRRRGRRLPRSRRTDVRQSVAHPVPDDPLLMRADLPDRKARAASQRKRGDGPNNSQEITTP